MEIVRNKKGQFIKGINLGFGFKKGNEEWKLKKTRKWTEESKLKASKTHMGRPKSEEFKQMLSKIYMGEGNPAWRGGIAKSTQRGRSRVAYKRWREEVLRRDRYECIWCGATERLESDHVKKWVDYPELRFDVGNGRTLCHSCHMMTRKKDFNGNLTNKKQAEGQLVL